MTKECWATIVCPFCRAEILQGRGEVLEHESEARKYVLVQISACPCHPGNGFTEDHWNQLQRAFGEQVILDKFNKLLNDELEVSNQLQTLNIIFGPDNVHVIDAATTKEDFERMLGSIIHPEKNN